MTMKHSESRGKLSVYDHKAFPASILKRHNISQETVRAALLVGAVELRLRSVWISSYPSGETDSGRASPGAAKALRSSQPRAVKGFKHPIVFQSTVIAMVRGLLCFSPFGLPLKLCSATHATTSKPLT